MISVENISKSYNGTPAVNDVSFKVAEGENLVLIGTSGSGKTTTLRMINRLIEPSSGNISINGESIYKGSQENLRRNMGYVLQHNTLFPHYTVAENIAIVPKLLGWDKQKIKSRSEDLLYKLQLSPGEYLYKYPNQLSGGQQQRVNVARALAANPPVLLMDEPFGALDPITRGNIVKDFTELDEMKKKTIILVTHDVQEAFEFGNRICVMDKGKIMQTGTPSELLFNPSNDYVRNFFEKQHLSLSFKNVSLNDLWDLIPKTESTDAEAPQFSANESLWKIMEGMMRDGEKQKAKIIIANEVKKETKTATLSDILTAFSLYKNAGIYPLMF